MLIKIKDIFGKTIINVGASSLKEAVEKNKANLSSADLSNAYLRNADGEKVQIKLHPVQIQTREYYLIIFDDFMQVGCEKHSLTDWFSFSESRIKKMDGEKALKWWRTWKEPLKQICKNTGRI